jgi:hypothetical protein
VGALFVPLLSFEAKMKGMAFQKSPLGKGKIERGWAARRGAFEG